MKNIHLLATDKSSRLCHVICTEKATLTLFEDVMEKGLRFFPQHIYITSDEEPKNGDWCIVGNGVSKLNTQFTSKEEINAIWKKIILTTDHDLIYDGLQAIDDEFLRWFVQNPSCDKVDLCLKDYFDKSPFLLLEYKIIIPQEEAKQENKKVCTCKRAYVNILSGICSLCWNEKFPDEKEEINEDDLLDSKQEKLEEVAKDWLYNLENTNPEVLAKKYPLIPMEFGFIQGAKWKAERSYSEEEVYNLLEKAMKECYDAELEAHYSGDYRNLKEWFKQNRKK